MILKVATLLEEKYDTYQVCIQEVMGIGEQPCPSW